MAKTIVTRRDALKRGLASGAALAVPGVLSATSGMAESKDAGVTLEKSDSLPKFLQEMFVYIDKGDFETLKTYFSDDFRLYFCHYLLDGVERAIGFVGAFDKRLPKYQHVMGDIFVGDNLTIFDGVLKVWLEDGTLIETPYYDKIVVDPDSGKITTMYAILSIAAVPEEYWKDLKPEDFSA